MKLPVKEGVRGPQAISFSPLTLRPLGTAELVRALPQVLQTALSLKRGIAESLFLAMRREIESAQLYFPITGGVCGA